jgi:hypothetical protein
MKTVVRRIVRLEKICADRCRRGGGFKLRFARLKILPRDYVGERHVVRIKGEPSESPDTDCQLEERPGPGRNSISGSRNQRYCFISCPRRLRWKMTA